MLLVVRSPWTMPAACMRPMVWPMRCMRLCSILLFLLLLSLSLSGEEEGEVVVVVDV